MAGYGLLSRRRDSFSIYFDGMLASFLFANLNGFFLSFFFFFLSSQLSNRQTQPRALHLLPRQLDQPRTPTSPRPKHPGTPSPSPLHQISQLANVVKSVLIAVVKPLITRKARRPNLATSRDFARLLPRLAVLCFYVFAPDVARH